MPNACMSDNVFIIISWYLVAVDRSVATVGGVSVVLRSAAVLHCVSLTTLQSDENKCKYN